VVLNHLAAMVFFAGPLFYAGLWMVLDPAGIASLAALALRTFGRLERRSGGPESVGAYRRLRTGVRCAGVLLVLFAMAI
jgi:hypothetical protein